ncbi:MAG: hypothetical protein JO340_01375 [Acidobacteriaceae bacterium]|nr:hypothetical protein [Acidobacteriaceae bacterium]
MKLFHTLGAIGLLAFAAVSPAAVIADSMRVHVPFAFVLAGQDFAPGDYVVQETDSGIVTVQGSGKAALALSFPLASAPGIAPGLRFARSDRKAYLVGIQRDEMSRAIPYRAPVQHRLTISRQ